MSCPIMRRWRAFAPVTSRRWRTRSCRCCALCAQAGLVSVGLVALDGSLLAGNASPGATRSYASIRSEVERMLAEAALADAAEDERLGGAPGGQFPAALTRPPSRPARRRRSQQHLEHAHTDERNP